MRAPILWMALGTAFCFALPAGSQTTAVSPHQLYDSLNGVRVDPAAVYPVKQVELFRADVKLTFEEGTLAFLTPVDGRVTGVVFSGHGRAFTAPRDPVEKQQMARFLGVPVLDEEFRSAYIRFSDGAAEELAGQFCRSNLSAQADPAYVAMWNQLLPHLNAPHSLRILADWLSANPRPYFAAALDGVERGMFDFVFDLRREEQVQLGQWHTLDGTRYYDVWASYRTASELPLGSAFRASHYSLETSILPDRSLDGTANVTIRAEREGERLITFELSRLLNVDSVIGPGGEELPFFQNEGLSQRERVVRGNDSLCVVLSEPPHRGREFTLRLRFRGSVISDAGNGVVFVGARGNWYPHLGGPDSFADYDLTLRWPRKLRLVATGTKLDEREEGDFRIGRWRVEKPVPVAGFNLGEYASASVTESGYAVEVFANRQLEQALRRRLAPLAQDIPMGQVTMGPEGPRGRARLEMTMPPPSPADALRQLAREVSSSIRFYEAYSGPFPYRQLNVSQIPGTFGQGWPGLLYVSTFSFLPADAQIRAGLSPAAQEHFSELVPFHEVAHQWWGNVVGWESYRDQWIDEAFANYLALLFADSQKNPGRALRDWLERYRARLLEKRSGEDFSAAEIGPLTLGSRLEDSKSPDGFERVIYPKGTWVIHMLRMLLRDSSGRNPDARFLALMRTLVTKYAYRALSTEDLQREIEAVMTPVMDVEDTHSMDWFFDDWVRGVGIPHYRVKYTVKRLDSGYLVRGKLYQSGVPRGFIAPVPLFVSIGSGKPLPLGAVIASGEETSFHFVTPNAPRKILVDPQMTLLCSVE